MNNNKKYYEVHVLRSDGMYDHIATVRDLWLAQSKANGHYMENYLAVGSSKKPHYKLNVMFDGEVIETQALEID